MMKCNAVKPEIEAYSLGALEPKTMQAISEHLKSCENCRSLYQDYNKVLEGLALEAGTLADEVVPPEGHKTRFMTKLAERPQLRAGATTNEDLASSRVGRVTVSRRPSTPGRTGWGWRRAAFVLACLWLVTLLGMGLTALNLQNQLNSQTAQFQAFNNQLSQNQRDLAQLKAQNEQLLQVNTTATAQLTDATERAEVAEKIALLNTKAGVATRSATNQQVSITVVMAPDEANFALFAHSWPGLKAGEEYRVWLYHTSGKLVPGGVIKLVTLPQNNLAQAYLTVPEPMANYTGLLVTIEKAGVAMPTGPEIVRDQLV